MIGIPDNMKGPWSPKGYLLLRHVLQRTDHRLPTLEWAAEMVNTTEFQLRRLIHQDNKMKGWFWRFIKTLEGKGWPVLVLFETEEEIHYNSAEVLPFNMSVEWRTGQQVLEWNSESRWWKSHGKD